MTTSKPAKVKLPRELALKAQHHLAGFMKLLPKVAANSLAVVPPEDRDEVRLRFLALINEVSLTMQELAQASGPSETLLAAGKVATLMQDPAYIRLLADGALGEETAAAMAAGKLGRPPEDSGVTHNRDVLHESPLYNYEGIAAISIQAPHEQCFEIALAAPCDGFGDWLLGRLCKVNGKQYVALAVEYTPLKPPLNAGDRVRLVVRAIGADGKPVHVTQPSEEPHAQGPACPDEPAESPPEGAAERRADPGPDGGGPADCPAESPGGAQPG